MGQDAANERSAERALDENVLTKLAQYNTPTICNVVELFEVRPSTAGYMDQRIRATFPEMGPVVGFAATATFRSAAPGNGGRTSEQVRSFAELPGPVMVVIQDLDDPPAAATFGDMMCSAYQAFGAIGLVTNGAGRDLDEVRALAFPVWTSGAICAHGYVHLPEFGVPVRVGGLTVAPGELIHADRNGVVTIPLEICDEVPQVLDEYASAEAILLRAMRDPAVSVTTLRAAEDEVGEAVERLRARVSRRSGDGGRPAGESTHRVA
jgi:4-hydroxy-4-methyl-2-oxoglutarate aldolase